MLPFAIKPGKENKKNFHLSSSLTLKKSLSRLNRSSPFLRSFCLIGGHDQSDGTQHPLLDRGAFLHPKRGQKDKRRATKRCGVDGAFQDFAVVAQIADFTGVPSRIDGDGTNVHHGQRRQQFFQGRVDQVTPVETSQRSQRSDQVTEQ